MRPIFLFLLISAVLAGCEHEAGPTNDAPATYRHALDGVPTSLDPAQAGNVYASALVVNAYDTLYRYRYLARPYELAPNLAAAMPEVSDDGLSYTIPLRRGVRFVDDEAFAEGRGREVVADDVIYSLKRHFDPEMRSRGAWLWRNRIEGLDEWGEQGADYSRPVSGLRAADDYTVEIRLTEPFPQLPYTLASALSAVVPREAVEHYGREFGIHAVGSGPFRLLEMDETRAVFERNPDFDRGPLDLAAEGYDASRHGQYGLESLDGRHYPFIDRLEVHFITEPTARWSSFVSGREVNNVMVPNEQAGRVLSSRRPIEFRDSIRDRYHHLVGPEAGFVFYGFNMDNPEIGYNDDPERQARNRQLRCAMRDAFDWQARDEAFYHGLGEIFPGVIPPFLEEFDDQLSRRSVTRDLQRARRRLAEHGWDADTIPELTYGMESSVHQRQMFEQFRAWMAAAGIPRERLRAKSHASFGDYSRAIANGRLDIFLLGWTMAYPDAQYSLQLFYGPNAAPGANSFNFSSEAFDRIFETAATLPPGERRTRLYRQLNRMVIDECVVIGALSRTRIHLWHKRARILPDREILGGFFLRFAAVQPESQ